MRDCLLSKTTILYFTDHDAIPFALTKGYYRGDDAKKRMIFGIHKDLRSMPSTIRQGTWQAPHWLPTGRTL